MDWYRIAKWWWIGWFVVAGCCLIVGITGMAFMPDEIPSPSRFPARFIVLGVAATAWGVPGLVASLVISLRK